MCVCVCSAPVLCYAFGTSVSAGILPLVDYCLLEAGRVHWSVPGERHTRHNKARVRRAWDARLEAGRVQRSG